MTNRSITFISAITTSLLVAATATALAEPTDSVRRSGTMPAISNSLEIAIAGNAAMGTGETGSGMEDLQDLTGVGGGAELQVGYRITPNLTVGGYLSFDGFSDGEGYAGPSRDIVTATAGLKADWHFLPATTIDPWISVGTGLRTLVVDQETGNGGNDRVLAGLELGRIQAGIDYRISPDFSVGPVIGASASIYLEEANDTMADADDFNEISDKGVNWTFTAGVLGRFNAFGSRN